MVMFRILSILALGIYIVCLFYLKVEKFLKNRYYYDFIDDELYNEVKSANSKNKIYFTKYGTKEFVKKYIISESRTSKYVVCNFTRPFKYINYFVLCYNKHKKVIECIEVNEPKTTTTSKIVAVPMNTDRVNIIIKSCDGVEVSKSIIKPLSIKSIRVFALLKALSLFLLLFALRQVVIELTAGPVISEFIGGIYNLMCCGGCLLIAIIYYLLIVKQLKKRNRKRESGGGLDYEFLQ